MSSKSGKVVFAITAAQLAQLAHPDKRLPRFRGSRRDPRDSLVDKGLLRHTGYNSVGNSEYERTREGNHVLKALEHRAGGKD